MKYADYLKTDYWKAVSFKVKERAQYRCQLCNSQHDLCAHHRTYEHRGCELDHLNDLVCLCRRCHEIFHGKTDAAPKIEAPPMNEETPFSRRVKAPKKRVVVKQVSDAEIETEMPQSAGSFFLTKPLIDKCRANGAFTTATLRALGVIDMSKGWVNRLEGKLITAEDYRVALRGRYIYSKKGAAGLLARQG